MPKGFSLIETLITLSCLSIIATLSAPAMERLIRSNSLASASLLLQADMAQARTKAVSSGRAVAIAPSSNGCWQCGWQVFVDQNKDGVSDSGDKVLWIRPRLTDRVELSSNTPLLAGAIFLPEGMARQPSGAFLAARFTLCSQGLDQKIELILNRAGRVRKQRSDGPCP